MHPVLVYTLIAIISALALLPVFEAYQLGSFKVYLLVVVVITVTVGKLISVVFTYRDPMQIDLVKERAMQKTRGYRREIQTLFNIIQPDPKMQPAIRRLDGQLQDYFMISHSDMQRRLRGYFGEDFDISLQQPLVHLVEAIQLRYPDWPGQFRESDPL